MFLSDEASFANLSRPFITDFGLSSILDEESSSTGNQKVGTFGYAAPEIFVENSVIEANPREDVWSCGIILYVLLCGELPFPASLDGNTSIKAHLEAAHKGPQFEAAVWNNVTDEAKDLIVSMLHYASGFRFSMRRVLKHSWFLPSGT
eukprot:snap_masked-scaffold_15-processed-gene-5.2-mRNA-1 protein AED:0.17 eAED:0.22 QI:0/-1/0/1/-1/1/1/0/147